MFTNKKLKKRTQITPTVPAELRKTLRKALPFHSRTSSSLLQDLYDFLMVIYGWSFVMKCVIIFICSINILSLASRSSFLSFRPALSSSISQRSHFFSNSRCSLSTAARARSPSFNSLPNTFSSSSKFSRAGPRRRRFFVLGCPSPLLSYSPLIFMSSSSLSLVAFSRTMPTIISFIFSAFSASFLFSSFATCTSFHSTHITERNPNNSPCSLPV